MVFGGKPQLAVAVAALAVVKAHVAVDADKRVAFGAAQMDGLVIRGSFPALMLSPVNFDALYAQELQRQQQSAQA